MDAKYAKRIHEAGMQIGPFIERYEGYSGRGMHGATTDGITGHLPAIMQAVALAAADIVGDATAENLKELEEFVDALGSLQSDNMGLEMIVY